MSGDNVEEWQYLQYLHKVWNWMWYMTKDKLKEWLYWWWTCMPTMFSSSAIMGSFTNLNLSSIISSFFRILCITCQLALGRGRGCYWLRAARVSDLSQWRRRTQRAWSSCSPTWRLCGLCLGFEELQTWLCRHRCRQSSSTPEETKEDNLIWMRYFSQ